MFIYDISCCRVNEHYKFHCIVMLIDSTGSESLFRNSYAVIQDIPRLVWNSNDRSHFHKSPPLIAVLFLMNPVHVLTLYFKINFNIILLSALRSPFCPFALGLSTKALLAFSFLPYVLHAFPISNSLSRSPQYSVKNNQATRCAVFFIFLLLPPTYITFY